MRRGVSGSRVPKHLHRPVTHDKQAETAGRERYDALVGERAERFWDGLTRRRVVLLSAAGELDVAVDRDDASDPTQSEAVGCIRRLPLLGYGKLSGRLIADQSGTVIQPSTHPQFALTVIFPEERKAMVCCATCTSTPCNPMLELDTAAQCTSNAASNPAGSMKSGDTSHSFWADQSVLSRTA